MRRLAFIAVLLACQAGFPQPGPDLIQDSLPKVVTVEVRGVAEDYETYKSTYTTKFKVGWFGAGAFISPDGLVLSCGHLFEHKLEDRQIIVRTGTGKRYRAILLAEDLKRDLSLLKVFPLHPTKYFKIGNPLARGQKVFAFGAPLAYEKSVSVGYVENLGIGTDHRTLHSAAINPGNSGGPLVSEDGRLVGVNVSYLVVDMFQRAEGMGQAVSLHDVNLFLQE